MGKKKDDDDDDDDDLDFDISLEEIEAMIKPPEVPESLDELVKTRDADKFLEKLMVVIDCKSDAQYRKLPPLSRLSVGINAFILETGSGGLGQFILNSDISLIDECLVSLKVIGASQTQEFLQKAINLFPDSKVPDRKSERSGILRKFEKKGSADPLRLLENEFHSSSENLPELLKKYLVKHKQDLSKETGLV